jgi:hypothetical protein
MSYANELPVLGLNDDCHETFYVNNYGHIGGLNELLKYLAQPHLVEYNIKVFNIIDCEEDDSKVDEWFNILMNNKLFLKAEARAFIELYERAKVITE